ncbi:MAG: YfbK domain-containing protein [Prosthecobacter sp.]|uniref:YfbK domain-containing protein n=1 Tax=Prosthecobacter sp. TaxID=1965333 RepID=UPI0039037103
MNPQDNPHFTAYALGELSAEEAHALHETLAVTPAAAHELEQIEAVTDALRHGAPIPQTRLTHEQRHALLHPANLPRRIQPMLPRKPAHRPRQAFWPVMGTLLKAAAAIAVTGAAFLAGWSLSPVVKDAAQIVATPPKAKPPVEITAKPQPVAEKTVAAPLVAAVPVKPEPVVQKEAPAPAPQKVAVVPAPAPAPIVVAAVKTPDVVTTTPNLGFTMTAGRGVFASTTKQASDQFNLRPALIKPVPQKPQGQAFASPQSANVKPEAKPVRVSELYIHSWKAEVAACPWNQANRLLRIVIQVPADQPAVLAADASFPLQITFDAANVKQFRMLSERHLAASELRSAGTHVLWYEFQPNGGEIGRDSGRQIASITLPNARFTSQAVGPFDSSRLQVIDRGYSLKNAREDFVFETSVVGFGLLLRGSEQVGELNHDLVLNLAKQAKGADASGERARFIRLVQDAQRVAGL